MASETTGRRRLLQGAALSLLSAAGAARAQSVDEFGDGALRGAGSTFVEPLMTAWVRQYRTDPYQVLGHVRSPDAGLGDALSSDGMDYEPVGSLAGIQRIRAGQVDFAASEMPLRAEALASGRLLQFPWTSGGIAIVVSGLRGGGEAIRLDAQTLSRIYLGQIRRWSDPALAALGNPGLPDEPIRVFHRGDGSGTTYTFASYLALRNEVWARQVGVDLVVRWPVGTGVRGSGGIVDALRATPFAIGYVNAVQARQAGLTIAHLRNQAGRMSAPGRESIAAALVASGAAATTGDGVGLAIDAGGEASYPLVATVFGLLRAPITRARQRRTAAFVSWSLASGQRLADRLGYVSLPDAIAKRAIEQLGPIA